MTATLILLAFVAWQQPAGAQTTLENTDPPAIEENVYYRWIDQQGRVQYTDFEPIGVPSQRVEVDPETAAVAAGESGPVLQSAEAEWQPDPFHDQDQQILPIEHIGPCADARQQLAVLHAELSVYRDANDQYRTAWRGDSYRGTRIFLTDEERQAAIAATRAAVLTHCSDPEAFENEVEAFKSEVKTR